MKTPLLALSTAFFLHTLSLAAEFTILHTSDVHGRLAPVEHEGKINQGGLAKRVSFFKQMRAQEDNILILDSGDHFQGTIYYDLYGGKQGAALMKHEALDAMALGNHEFNADEAGLRELLKLNDTPTLSANIEFSDPYVQDRIKSHIVKTIDGENILIIGVTTPNLMSMTKSQSIKVYDAIPIVEKIAAEVPHDYLIVLSHCGFAYDKQMLAKLPQIDLILGGHDHYQLAYHSPNGSIIHNGSFGTQVGVLSIDTEKKSIDARVELMDEDIQHDAEVDAALRVIDADIAELKSQKVAETRIVLQGTEKEIESQPTTLAQLVLKSMISAFDSYDAVIVQAGSIRAYRDLTGDISYTDVMQILPFKGKLVQGELTGKDLKSILEKGKKSGESYLHYRLKDSVIVDDKIYKVITNDYLAAGKDGYDEFLRMQNTHTTTRDCFEILYDFLKQNPVIDEAVLKGTLQN